MRKATLAVGALLLLSGCAGLRSSQTSPSAEASPSAAQESPSPSPSPTTSSGPLQITSAPFHAGEVGLNYGVVNLGAQGGVPPYTWSIKSGAIPPGLALATTGALSGKNTKTGKYTFTFQVADSAGATAAKATSITVYSALKVTQKCVTKCVIGGGCTKCGAFGTVTGGMPPYSYSIASGNVPKGMSWTGLSMKGGFPTGTYSFAVAVGDQLGANATVSANWSVYTPARLTGGSSCIDSANPPQCTTTGWTYSGGNPTTPPKVVIVGYKQYCSFSCYPIPTAPPMDWTVTVKSGVITMSAGGIPCNQSGYGGILTLALVDTTACATPSKSNLVDLAVEISNNC